MKILMKTKSRAAVDAFCGSRATLYQRLVEFLAPAILLAVLAYVLIIWHRLPEKIPIHYNLAGEADGWGGRGHLLVMPLIGLVTDAVIAIAGRLPQSWNIGVRVNAFNRARVYRVVRDLMADVRLACALLFAGLSLLLGALSRRPPSLGVTLGVTMVLLLAPILRYVLRIGRAR